MKQIITFCFLLVALFSQAQLRVTGVVTSADDGSPLPGAPVQVKENPSAGVATDIDGNYTVQVAPGQTLVFSYVGCKTQEFKITAARTLNVML